ncbi:MFS transporter, DHA2 family, multidrug resistance protein [Filimonas lacunae]|uniref:MFS transporter, DHA2 family, multidrug resistance protein n=1 Tax=Filimonas lacunae TaxID=477680 RepID=A0A173M9Z8_9BACT|nr:MDR family MFS transporter [Filimonas lacunae]BAV04341.1 drug resistance transporter, EmrB/QacA family protein [Filimonas lacunae]SIT31072.1 MFS transporter, DHA2 family, multidrug resistance protein [Filimonas lacunae]
MLRDKVQVLVTLMIGTSMAAIDSSIVNVSLPVIQKEFGVGVDDVTLVVTAYMITFLLFIPLTNWLKNRIGYYNLYIGSITLFTLGSLLCSLSGNLEMLVIARVVQAIGGGAIAPSSLGILSENFPREERGSAIGWWGIGNVMGPALGPTLGGVLTQYLGWESIFYVNIPIGVIAILLAFRYLGFLKAQPKTNPPFDVKGYLLFVSFVILLQWTLTCTGSKYGFASWQFIGGVIVTLLSFYLFVRSARRPQPLMDLSVFTIAGFNRAFIIVAIRSLALFGGMFFLPFLLQGLLGYSEIQSAMLLLPNALIMLVTRPLAGKLADKGLIRNISIVGIVLLSASFFLFARINIGTPVWFIIIAMLVRGLGISFLIAPVSTAMLNAVELSQTATATSLNSLMLQLGGSVGIAISGSLHSYIYAHYLAKQYPQSLSEHYALQDGFIFTAVVILLAIIPAVKLPQKVYKRLRDKEALGA